MAGSESRADAGADVLPAAAAGYIWPAATALAVLDRADGVRLVNAARGEVTSATGTMAQAVRQFVETGQRGPVLAALGAETPLGRTLAELEGQPRMPLRAAAALRLDGFDTLFLEVVGACNQRCLHCYAASDPTETARLSRSTCESVLVDARLLGFRRVQLTGGEPLLCEFLPELVARVRALEIAECEIFTNGLLLDQRTLDTLAPHRPSFAFSVYSHDPSTHDSITGVPDSHRRTVEAIDRVLRAGLAVRAAMVSMEANRGHAAATFEYLSRLGVPLVGVSGARGVGRGATCACTLAEPVPEFASNEAPARASGALCVSYDGSVYPCIFNRADRIGDVLERPLAAIANAPELRWASSGDLDRVLSRAVDELQCPSCRLTACALFACASGAARGVEPPRSEVP
jgi:MoaA/NifB/PqqE/SkfB family radical SAM enzyme